MAEPETVPVRNNSGWDGEENRRREMAVIMNPWLMKVIATLLACVVGLLGWLCTSTMQLREQMSAVFSQGMNNATQFKMIWERLDKHEQIDTDASREIEALKMQMAEARGVTKSGPGTVADTLNKIYAMTKENSRRIDGIERSKP